MARAYLQAVVLLLVIVLATGCDGKDSDPDPVANISYNERVLVACEGSFGNGNGALTVLPAYSDSAVVEDAYYAANNSKRIGDVFQSIEIAGNNQLFLCVNNSDKVLVLNRTSFRLEGSINVSKPRYLFPVSTNKAYVTTLFSNKLYVINTSSLQVEKIVALPYKNPEGLRKVGEKVYVCTWDTGCHKVYVLDPATDAVTDSVAVAGAAPQEILEDATNKLWVVSGNDSKGAAPVITCIDPVSKTVVKSFAFSSGADVMRPTLNASRDTLYWLQVNYYGRTVNNGVYRMPISATALPTSAFVPAQKDQYFWALGVDPYTGLIYVGDPKGFTQKGDVMVYGPQGNRVRSFKTGVGPGHFYFHY
jgi:YVTN family beta-propeller protein